MRERQRSIHDEVRAESIESGNDVVYRGLVGAIQYLTRSDLEKLGDEYRAKKVSTISLEAEASEQIIARAFSLFLATYSKENPYTGFELTVKTKEIAKDILPAIQHLYNLRYGEVQGGNLNALLNSNVDEPYFLIFLWNRDKGGKMYIEKMILKKREIKKEGGKE